MKMKKLLASALAAAMVVSSMVGAMVTSAETTTVGTITAGTVDATVGETDTVAVPVVIEFTEGIVAPHNIVTVAIQGYTFTSVADVNVTYVEGQGPDAGKDQVDVDPDGSNLSVGKILLETAVDETAPTVTKIAFTANFTDADDVDTEPGTYPITVNGDDMTDVNERTIGITAVPGSLTVAEKEPEHECTAGTPVPNNDGTHNIPCADPECDKFVEVNTPCNYVEGICSVCGFADPNYVGPCDHANATLEYSVVDGNCVTTKVCPDCDAEPEVIASIANTEPAHSLALESDLTINYKINKTLVEGYSDIHIVIEKQSEGVEASVTTLDAVSSGSQYIFPYLGVKSTQMRDNLVAEVYATNSDGYKVLILKEDAYSIRTYIDKAYAYYKNSTAGTKNAAFRTLLVDLANYGAAAQTYFGYKDAEEQLANYGIEQTYASALPTEFTSVLNETGAFKMSKSLDLAAKILVNIKITKTNITSYDSNTMKLTIEYQDSDYNKQTLVVPYSDFVSSGNVWLIAFDKLSSVSLSTPFTATLTDANGDIAGFTYSAETYAWQVNNAVNSGNTSMVGLNVLTKSMMAYGSSAKAYFYFGK